MLILVLIEYAISKPLLIVDACATCLSLSALLISCTCYTLKFPFEAYNSLLLRRLRLLRKLGMLVLILIGIKKPGYSSILFLASITM